MSIILATGQHGSGDAGQFVGDCNDDLIARSTLREPAYPLPESSGVVLDAQQYGAGTVDLHLTWRSRAHNIIDETKCLQRVVQKAQKMHYIACSK